MGAVLEEFQRSLAEWRDRYRDQPRRELQELALLALEREELVAVSYRAPLLRQRVEELSAPPEVKELVRSALLWVWRDEEAHAIYIRGALLRIGGFWLALRTFLQQLAGSIGGWAASVQQHLTWRRAPLARFAAWWVTLFGIVAAKVPRAVRRELRHQTFRDFCEFNVDAELTAHLAWARFLELVTSSGGPEDLAGAARAMRDDEERHRQIFELFARAFSPEGAFLLQSAEELRHELERVSPMFLPAEGRRPWGRDARVFVESAATPELGVAQVLDKLELGRLLEEKARGRGVPPSEMRVAVKTTFMMGYHKSDRSPVIDPRVVDALERRPV